MSSKRLLVFASLLAVAAALAAAATRPLAAQGARDHLNGTYFSTGTQACLASPYGFTNLVPNNVAAAFVQSSSAQGTFKFNGDGTGTAQFQELGLNHPPATSTGGSSSAYSFPFTYTIADDGTLTLDIGTLTGTILTGSLKGVNFTLTNLPLLSGRIARDGSVFMLTPTDPTVEVLTLALPTPFALPRICQRQRTIIPIHVEGWE